MLTFWLGQKRKERKLSSQITCHLSKVIELHFWWRHFWLHISLIGNLNAKFVRLQREKEKNEGVRERERERERKFSKKRVFEVLFFFSSFKGRWRTEKFISFGKKQILNFFEIMNLQTLRRLYFWHLKFDRTFVFYCNFNSESIMCFAE